MTYQEFLQQKQKNEIDSGFSAKGIKSSLFPFQKFCVEKALEKGRFALFEDCGLGKTIQQLEWSNQVVKHTNAPVLILAPLSVSGQTILEGLNSDTTLKDYPLIRKRITKST